MQRPQPHPPHAPSNGTPVRTDREQKIQVALAIVRAFSEVDTARLSAEESELYSRSMSILKDYLSK